MTKINLYRILIFLIVIVALSIACSKHKEEVQPSAQNIYQIPSFDPYFQYWFLTKKEFGAFYHTPNWVFFKEEKFLSKMSYDFSAGKYTNQLITTYQNDTVIDKINIVTSINLKQLDETRFLQIIKSRSYYSNGNDLDYKKVYLTDVNLNNPILIPSQDSSYNFVSAALTPDDKIILLEYGASSYKLSCIKESTIEWVKILRPGSLVSDFIIGDEFIYLMSRQTKLDLIERNFVSTYDFNGNEIIFEAEVSKGANDFAHMTGFQQSIILTGMKYNVKSKNSDFWFSILDKNLSLLKEKVVPINSIIKDWDFFINNLGSQYVNGSKYFGKPAVIGNTIWIPVFYQTNKFGYSLKLIKLNSSLEIEMVKPIIENLPYSIKNVAVRTDNQYLYLGGLNSKGAFYYRMDKTGNFK